MAKGNSLVFSIVAKDKASKVLERVSDKVSDVALGAGAAGGAALGAGFSQYLDVGAANAKLSAQLGTGVAESERLGKVASSLYQGAWGDSMETVSEAVRSTYQNLGDTASVRTGIEGVTKDVLALSETMGQDFNAVTAAAGNMIRNNLVKTPKEAFDLLTVGFQKGVNKADDLLETINEYAPQFDDLGLSGSQAMGILSQGIKAGARDSDYLADAIKEFTVAAVDGTDKTADGFKMIGLNAKRMQSDFGAGGDRAAKALDLTFDKLRAIEDPVKREAAAVSLFGSKAEDLQAALYAIDPSSATASLGQVGGAAETMAGKIADTPAAAIERFKREMLTKLSEIAASLIAFGTEHKTALMGFALVFGTLAGFVMIVGAAVKVYNAVMVTYQAVTIAASLAQRGFNAAWAANPIGIVILLIIALVGVIILLWNKNETFRKVVTAVWNGVVSVVRASVSWVVGAVSSFGGALGRAWGWITSRASSAVNSIQNGWNRFIGWLRTARDSIGRFARGIGDALSSPFRSAFGRIRDLWNSTVGGFRVSIPDWVPQMGGRGFSFPRMAAGGIVTAAGAALVGERGPEILTLPQGASVAPLPLAGRGAGGPSVVRIEASGDDVSRFLLRLLRKSIRDEGGNVQVVIGTGG